MTERQAPRWLSRPGTRDLVVVAGACLGALIVYALTMPPSLTGGDSGEFITAVYVLGVVHPTGYPLYMLLGKLFETLIPFGEVAFRLALFSVVCAAVSAALVAWVYLRCGGGRLAALLAGLATAFASVVWSEAVIAEVYALNELLVMAGLAAFVVWWRRRTPRSLIVACAALGLTVGHHRTGGLALGPFVIAAVLLHRPVSLKVLAKAAGAFAATLVLYVYFPIRSAAFPPAAWTSTLDWHEMGRFLAGTDWASKVLARRGPRMWAFLGDGLNNLRGDVSVVGMALAAVGWGALARRSRVLWICSTAGLVLTGAWGATYDVWDAAVFFVPCYLFIGLWLAAGTETVARGAAKIWRREGARLLTARAVVAAALIAIPARELTAAWGEVDLSGQWYVRERGEVVLANIQPRALMVVRGHASYTMLLYLTLVEGLRPDVLVASSGLLGNTWYQVGVPDRNVRLAAEDTTVATLRWQIATPEDFSPYLARRILARSPGGRPFYTNFEVPDLPPGYWHKRLPGELFQITNEPMPKPQRAAPPGRGQAAFPLGLDLAGAEVRPARVRPGETFALDLYWRPQRAVEQPIEIRTALVPQQDPSALPASQDEGYPFALEYGALPLNPTKPGEYYRQTVALIASRSLPAGPCALRLQVAAEGITSRPRTVATLEVAR